MPCALDVVWRWWMEAAVLAGLATDPAIGATWTPPRREMIDPVKEVKALKDQVRAGLLTLSEAIRMLGYDPRELLGELSDDLEILDELGLQVESDPRTSSAPAAAPPPAVAAGAAAE